MASPLVTPLLPRRPARPRGPRWLILALALALGACALPFGPSGAPEEPPPTAEALFLRARLLELDGKLAEAAEAYEEAARLDPNSAELQRFAARLQARLGRIDQALEHAERAHALDPSDEETRRGLAALYIQTQRYDEAAALLETALDDETLSEDAVFALFNLYLETDRLDEAQRAAELLVDRVPGSIRGYLALAAVAERRGDRAAAERAVRRGLEVSPSEGALYDVLARIRREAKDVDGELAVLREKLAALPDDPLALYRTAELEESRGHHAEAIKALEQLGRAHPELIDAQLQLAFSYYQAGRKDEAVRRFIEVERRNPERHEARYFLAIVYQESQQLDEAYAAFESIPRDSERFADARRGMARILEERKQHEQALALVDEAIEASPDDVDLQVFRAGLLQRAGDLDGALDLMRKLIAEDPENAELHFDMGVIHGEGGQQDEAMRTMQDVLERSPDHAGALNYVGYTWADNGERLEEAERMIRRALELRPEDGFITDSLGWVLYKRGLAELAAGQVEQAHRSLADAVKELERALALLEPDDPIITWHLADAYRSVSRFQEALTTYRRALELRPEQDDAARIQEQIDLLELQLKGASSGKVP